MPMAEGDKNRTCSHKYLLAQWIPGGIPGFPLDQGPHLFYLNCDGSEEAISGLDGFLFGNEAYVSPPLDYWEPTTERDSMCHRGAVPVPQKVKDTVRVYRDSFAKYVELERPYKQK